MDASQYLFYGLGQIAYSIAIADGQVQKEERARLYEMVKEGFREMGGNMSYTEIIFAIEDKDRINDGVFLYEQGMRNLEMGKHKFTPELKEGFLALLEEIADAFDDTEASEANLLTRFKKDVETL